IGGALPVAGGGNADHGAAEKAGHELEIKRCAAIAKPAGPELVEGPFSFSVLLRERELTFDKLRTGGYGGPMQESLTIRRPDDWHVHLRDGDVLAGVLPYTARQFARAIVMPNLNPPMTDTAGVAAYRDRILAALPDGSDFTPLMTLYLTDHTDPDDVARGFGEGVFVA